MVLPRMTVSVAVLAIAGLSACSNEGLRDLRSNTGGPDEFMVLPSEPLVQPPSYSDLPPPNPGGGNITDPQPKADAVAALGGNPAALAAQGVPAADSALVATVGRYGIDGQIRSDLAVADAEFRQRRGRLTQFRLFRSDLYSRVYSGQSIDPFAETQRFRRSGIQTPTSPPATD